jgi:hypothetical protein
MTKLRALLFLAVLFGAALASAEDPAVMRPR